MTLPLPTATAPDPSHIAGPAYRPDVDGLRAIAVLAVLGFHAFADWLPGGFVGVDVFFVISGFLITSLISREMARGEFTFGHFYGRRTLRIFPALIVVLLLGWGVGWIALTSNEYGKYGKYMAGGAAFADNFMFWRDAGYFDSKAEVKPLLHLWSLGIEEQFYLAWPVILLGLRRWRDGALAPALLLLAASLAYSLYKVRLDVVADFYSPLTRFWELLAGATLALWQAGLRDGTASAASVRLQAALNRAGAPLGAALLVAALLCIDPARAFPGAWALLPVTGAVLLIAAGPQGGWVSRLLSHPLLVGIGLISYPLYLWHWPLLSFARIFNGHTPPAGVRALLLAVAFLLAWLTYRWIERPLRFGLPGRRKVRWLLVVMAITFGLGHWVSRGHGMAWRHEDKLQASPQTMVIGADRDKLLAMCDQLPAERSDKIDCLQKFDRRGPRWVVLGDSKAEAIFYGLVRESPASLNWTLIGGLSPLNVPPWWAAVQARILADPDVQGIVLGNAWRGLTRVVDDTDRPIHEPDAAAQADWLRRHEDFFAPFLAAGKRVVMLRDNPTLPDPNDCIAGDMTSVPGLRQLLRRRENPLCELRLSTHLEWTRSYDAFLAELHRRHPQVLVYSQLPLLCDRASDRCPMHRDGAFLYSYGDHISDAANSPVARDMFRQGLFDLTAR
ncbi:MAG: hypothetical protein RIQ60_4471 [Pseudomonadota bacterium]|jgi:peptidoglycan/LPS O-acetylase OafA/YrhL